MLDHPSRLIWIAAGLMIAGVVLPFLMVLDILESNFFVNFLAFIAQVVGFILGFVGVAMWHGKEKRKDKDSYKDR